MKKLFLLGAIFFLFSQCKTNKTAIVQKDYANANRPNKGSITSPKKNIDIVTEGLIAFYPLNKTADDLSGNNNDGKLFGGVTPAKDRFGNKCGALRFNGTDAYVQVPSSPSLNEPKRQVSIAGWFKIDANSSFSDLKWVTMVCKSKLPQEESNSPQYRLQLTSQTISLNTDFTENVHHPFFFDQWHFYAMIYDGSEVVSYLDGKKIFEFPYWKPLQKNDLPLEIGRDVPGNMEYFAGCLDDIRIYNRSLSSREVSELYNDESSRGETFGCGQPERKKLIPEVAEVEKHEIDVQHEIEVNNQEVTVYIYDHARPDGDIVSINLNDQWMVDKHELKRKHKKIEKTMHFTAQLKPNQTNILYSKAWNLGKNPPNTLTVEIHDNFNKPQRVILNSEIGKSGAIRINCVL